MRSLFFCCSQTSATDGVQPGDSSVRVHPQAVLPLPRRLLPHVRRHIPRILRLWQSLVRQSVEELFQFRQFAAGVWIYGFWNYHWNYLNHFFN